MARAEVYSPLAVSATEEHVSPPKLGSHPWQHQGRAFPEGAVVHSSEPVYFPPPQAVPRVPAVEVASQAQGRLIALQAWEGVVLEVGEDDFAIRAVDVAGEHADEQVTLAKDELSEFDLDLLEPGAILYWTIGYREQSGGGRERVSQIRLRRLPAWNETQLDEVEARAVALARDLGW